MSKHWEPCPRCGSNKVTTLSKKLWFLLALGFGGIFILLGFLILPLLFVGFIMAIFSPLALFMPRKNLCQDCKHSWKIQKTTALSK